MAWIDAGPIRRGQGRRRPSRGWRCTAQLRRQLRQHILGILGQDRTPPQQIVAPATARIEWRTRYGEDVAALFECKPRRDQRARAGRGFDDYDAERHPRNDPVAAREMPCLGLGSERQFREDRSLTRQRLMESTILFGIDDIDT